MDGTQALGILEASPVPFTIGKHVESHWTSKTVQFHSSVAVFLRLQSGVLWRLRCLVQGSAQGERSVYASLPHHLSFPVCREKP